MATLAITLAVACSTSDNGYERAIADYVQRDRFGTFTDCKFKALSIEKKADITVADSLRIMEADFETERAALIASEEKSLKYWLETQAADKNAKYAKEATGSMLANNIALSQHRIDSLRTYKPDFTTWYADFKPDEVLALKVECRYSFVLPGSDRTQERTDTFILSADGKEVKGKDKKTN